MLLRSLLPSAKVLPTIIEVYHRSKPRFHRGEELVYMLKSPVRINVAGRDFIL